MFVSKNQFYIFIACFLFGAICGLIFGATSIFSRLIKNKFFCFFSDIISISAFAVLFSIYSYKMNFSNLRAYMLLGVFIGFICYVKSFHIILANLLKKFYNIIKPKNKQKRVDKNDRRKSKKGDSGNNGRGSASARDFARNNGVSNDFN